MPAKLSKEEKAAYVALMRVVLASPRAVAADIAPCGGLVLSDHLALLQLAEAPGRKLRMTEIAVACGVSLSGITRIIGRLEDEGLVTRTRSVADARGAIAALTEAGQARLKESDQMHANSVRRHVFSHLDKVDLAYLALCMDRIADSMMADDGLRGRRARHGQNPRRPSQAG